MTLEFNETDFNSNPFNGVDASPTPLTTGATFNDFGFNGGEFNGDIDYTARLRGLFGTMIATWNGGFGGGVL